MAAVQSTHARYGNEGWGLIIISSLPVRDEPPLFQLFFRFFPLLRTAASGSTGVYSDLESWSVRGGAGSTLWLNAASCGYSAGTFKPFILSLVFT